MKVQSIVLAVFSLLAAVESAHADCWRDQRTGKISCTNANSTPPTMQHGSGTVVTQPNPYAGKAVISSAKVANDAAKVVTGSAAVAAGTAAEATVLGVPIGVAADTYGAYKVGSGLANAPKDISAAKTNIQQAHSWKPTEPPKYVPPKTQYQRMCRDQKGVLYPC